MREAIYISMLLICIASAVGQASSVLFCKDVSCDETSDVFMKNDTIYIKYTGDASQAMALLSNPDGSKESLALPASIKLDMAGTYTVDVIAGDPGERADMTTANIQVIGDAPEPLPPDDPRRQEPAKPQPVQEPEEEGNSLMVLIYITLGALAIIGMLFLLLRMKHKAAKPAEPPAKSLQTLAVEHNVHQPHEYMNQVVSYISESLRTGYSTQDIYNHLQSQGWSEDQINDGFERYDLLGTYQNLKDSNMPEDQIKAELSKDYQPKQIEETLRHHSAILGRDATVEERAKHLDQLAHDHKVHLVDSRSAKMKQFLQQCFSHGYAMDHIRAILTQLGWSQEKIENASRKLLK